MCECAYTCVCEYKCLHVDGHASVPRMVVVEVN